MRFTPENKTIKSLIKSYPKLCIPNFQREYSWDKYYYSTFFRDIVFGLKQKENELKQSEYFIGIMVFSRYSESDPEIHVIDGQQRLTVITIILSVITRKLLDLDQKKLAEATFEYIKTTDDYGNPIAKLETATSHPYFEGFVQSDKKQEIEPATEEEENIKKTYDFFEKELNEEILKDKYSIFKNISYSDALIAIRDQILQMSVISIITEDKEHAYDIFEILNAKGKNLAAIDLIKNTIYAKFYQDKNTKEELITKKWEDIKKILRERSQNIGFATFYRHYWLSKYAKKKNTELYDNFKKKIKDNKDEYEKFVEDLYKESKTYLTIVCPDNKDYQNKKQYFWLVQSLKEIENTFGVSQARIVLLALFDLKIRNLITNKVFKNAVIFIENFIFAYSAVLKKQANIYESNFSKLAIKLRECTNNNEIEAILKELLYETFGSKFPAKDEFISRFCELEYSKLSNPTNQISRYVLNKISSKKDGNEIFAVNSSIEHILNEDFHNKVTLNIGNLICLEIKLNREAGNADYATKRDIYKKSKYDQVGCFWRKYKNFSEKDIISRAKILAEYYYDEIINFKGICNINN